MEEYKVKYYINQRTGNEPVREYIKYLEEKDRVKVRKYITYLRQHQGYLDEPYSKHITGKIRELRVDFAHNRHRIFYFTFINRNIVLLSAFLKKTDKTPPQEIEKALANYYDVVNNPSFYE
jgi:phage-related protein